MNEDPNKTSSAEETKQDDGQDPIKQLKGEFNRKLGKNEELLNQLLTTQAQLQEALTRMAAPKAAPAADDNVNLDELLYSDPKKYAAIIKEQAKEEAVAAVRQENSTQSGVNSVIAALAAEYPELSDQESPLTKASVEILKGASDADKKNPRTYEYAVLKAAQALEMQPKSKRKQAAEDDFVAPSYASPQARGKKRTNDQVVNANREIAGAMGVNLDDPKTKERYLNLLKSKGIA
jgi:hypothetical protein